MLFVKVINNASDAEEIQHVFVHYGRVIDVHVPTREEKARNFAFMRYLHVEEGSQEERGFGCQWQEDI